MNVLIVEDNPDYIDVLSEMTSRLSGDAYISVRTDAESASALIQKEFFDLVVLDMSIPAQAVDATDKPAHGMLGLAEAQQKSPGTPILILTGSSAREYGEHIEELVKGATKADIWGSAEELEMVNFSRKRDLLSFEGTLGSYIKSYEQTRGVELDRGSLELPLTYDRLLRIFARSIDGATCTVASISGVLSGTPVFFACMSETHKEILRKASCANWANCRASLTKLPVTTNLPTACLQPQRHAKSEFSAGGPQGTLGCSINWQADMTKTCFRFCTTALES
ncbi:response regulator [Paraburkholderia sp. 1N]|uniref:Response regulator n=1 Tax=Paraburkholderia solitsugae TaxID=2675748 RepID=A0ABX2C1B2_9BURK|nr:response regulator [Paraburkholderia solitsugae]NPT46863.1 response regulator [Paraburkholderia solitsugae]